MKNGILIIVLLISGLAFSQTPITVKLENQCNCQVLNGTDVTDPGDVNNPADVGDIYINTDSGLLFFWDGDSWELTSGHTVKSMTFAINKDNRTLELIDINSGEILEVSLDDIKDEVNTDNQNLANVLGEGADAGDVEITGLLDPTAAQSAATRNYVDSAIATSAADGSETKLINGTTTTVTGDGKDGSAYKVEVAAESITSTEIKNGTVANEDLADAAVQTENILD
ncbi:hypothetical protein JM658_04610, partial [Joostella atrarenae]|nr:hypothetical protein [Joostella atrarenae]